MTDGQTDKAATICSPFGESKMVGKKADRVASLASEPVYHNFSA